MAARGLSATEAGRRLAAEGANELPRPEHRTPYRIALEVLQEPMLALLLGAGFVYLLIGDTTDALVLLVFASLSIAITVIQEARTERVLESLRALSSPRALVIRDGERRRIAGRDVVRGDLVVLGEGDRVPADGALLEFHELMADESLLTGESVPVRKSVGKSVFSGTLVVRGSGLAEITATGARSEIGKIGHSLGKLETEPPRLRRQMQKFVKLFAIMGTVVSLLAVALYGLTRGNWLEALLAGIALGMSLLPEEFPVVLTIFMAMGAWRISRARVLTRRATAIEALGSATVLCSDKTGTLTENHMRIAELRDAKGRVLDAGGKPFAEIVRHGVLASAANPFDPMEQAFHALADKEFNTGWTLEKAYGLRPDLLAMSHVWKAGKGHVIASKGAPETIMSLCKLDARARKALQQSIEDMAANGLRVLGVARASHRGRQWPESQKDFHFTFLGLVGLADPLRGNVPAAIAECRRAGIRVMMITGDYPATAAAIARQAGLDTRQIVTGAELGKMDTAALAARLDGAPVFARIMPEQKLRIVEALKARGEVVAMTGDGVNDAPSLKAAHIGIAMGGRGTDVAREASAIVLLDDDFDSIVKAVRLGRRIYDNLKKAAGFIFAIHMPIAGLAILPLVTGLPIILGPMHIALLEMIIDPVCTLVFEAEEEEGDAMSRPPRPPAEPLFTRSLIARSVLQGLAGFAAVAAVFLGASSKGMEEPVIRSMSFLTLVLVIVAFILVNRSHRASLTDAIFRRNRALALVLMAVAAVLAAALLLPVARDLLKFGVLGWTQVATAAGVAVAAFGILELIKLAVLRQRRPQP